MESTPVQIISFVIAFFAVGGPIFAVFRRLGQAEARLRNEMKTSNARCEERGDELRQELTELRNVTIAGYQDISMRNNELTMRNVSVLERIEKIANRYSSSGQHLAVRDHGRDHG